MVKLACPYHQSSKFQPLGFPKRKKNWPGLCFTRYVSEWFRATYRSSCRQSPRNHRKFRGSIFLTTQICWPRNTQKPAARASKDSHIKLMSFLVARIPFEVEHQLETEKKIAFHVENTNLVEGDGFPNHQGRFHLEDLSQASAASPTHQLLILHKGRGFDIFVFENGWGSCKTPQEPRCFNLKIHGETKFASCSVQDSV